MNESYNSLEDSIVKVENEILQLSDDRKSTSLSLSLEASTSNIPPAPKSSTHFNSRHDAGKPKAGSSKGVKELYYCHMPRCERKVFTRKESHQIHLSYHKLKSVYGCLLCHSLNPNVKVIINHLKNKHGFKNSQCLDFVYKDTTRWKEPTEATMLASAKSNNGLVIVKVKRTVIHVIDVNNLPLQKEFKEDEFKSELKSFANGGLFEVLANKPKQS